MVATHLSHTHANTALQRATRRMKKNRRNQFPLWAWCVLAVGAIAWASFAAELGYEFVVSAIRADDPTQGVATQTAWAARQLLFWFNIVQVAIFSYSTFEGLYRRPDTRLLLPLPIQPASWFRKICADILLNHSFVAVTGLAISVGVGMGAGWRHGVAWIGGGFAVFLTHLSLSLWLHVRLGETVRETATDSLRGMLTQGLAANSAAYLFYSPAIAFAFGATLTLAMDVITRLAYETGSAVVWVVAITLCIVVTIAALRSARTSFSTGFAAMLPRFWESETVDPFRETYLPPPPRTFGVARFLDASAQRFFRLYLVQMRRRYRVDGLLYAGVLTSITIIVLRTEETQISQWLAHTMLGLWCNILFFFHIPRVLGPAINAESLTRSLPISETSLISAQRAAAALSMAPVTITLVPILALGGYSLWLAILSAAIVGTGSLATLVLGTMFRRSPLITPRVVHWALRAIASFGLAALMV